MGVFVPIEFFDVVNVVSIIVVAIVDKGNIPIMAITVLFGIHHG